MKKLSKRQLDIFDFVKKRGGASNKEIKEYLGEVSRITVVRDVEELLSEGLIRKEGEGRSVRYFDNAKSELLRYIDVEEYFSLPADERNVKFRYFNRDIFANLSNMFTDYELETLTGLNDKYQERIKKLPPAILKKEFERLTIELSWKSSRIEGNTYSLLETEALIKEREEAEGHSREEAIMILNHKAVMDYIKNSRNEFKNITIAKIENIQRMVVKDLGVSGGLRKVPVGVTGTQYRPLVNTYQIEDALNNAISAIDSLKAPFSKALTAILMISYIQPFEDGNKRTARLLGNALLLAYNACPLSFRSIDELDYKKAIIIFYEQNSARFFKELFVEQFKFAVDNYFLA